MDYFSFLSEWAIHPFRKVADKRMEWMENETWKRALILWKIFFCLKSTFIIQYGKIMVLNISRKKEFNRKKEKYSFDLER